jgi:hypothetical protein
VRAGGTGKRIGGNTDTAPGADPTLHQASRAVTVGCDWRQRVLVSGRGRRRSHAGYFGGVLIWFE